MTDPPSAPGGQPDSGLGLANAAVGPDDDDRTYVTAFSRGLAVIRCFSTAHPSLSIAEVAKATGLNRATARRFLLTLETDGYASAQDGRYILRPRILELGYTYLASLPLDQLLRHDLLELADQVRGAGTAGILDGHDVIFVARAETSFPRVMTTAFQIGSRTPAYFTALGRVLLAGLKEDRLDEYLRTAELRKVTDQTITDPAELRSELLSVRAKGHCIADEQIQPGVRAVAVPVHTAEGVTLAISVASHVPVEVMESSFVPPLKAAAARIEHLLRLRN